jgi:hypothetical protein
LALFSLLVGALAAGHLWSEPAGSGSGLPATKPPRIRPSADVPPAPPDWELVRNLTFSRFAGIDQVSTWRFMQEHMAEEMAELKQKSGVRPDDAVAEFTDLVQQALVLIETKTSRPERFERLIREKQLEKKILRLRDAISASEGKDREEKMKELQAALGQSFEIRQELMKMEVEYLSQELDKLKTLVRRREENRTAIVNRRIVELTGQEDALKW